MRSRSRPGLRRSQAIWECPNRGPSGPVFLGKSQTWTRTAGFGPVQTGFQSVWDRTSPTLGDDLQQLFLFKEHMLSETHDTFKCKRCRDGKQIINAPVLLYGDASM